MNDKEFQKVTADDIAEIAGVGRATWFRNFKSKEDAIRYKLRIAWERFAEERNLYERNRFDIRDASAFFEYNAGMKKILKTIYQSGLDMLVFEVFKEIMVEPQAESPNRLYREKFYAYGLYGLLDGWVRRDFKETPEDMCQMTVWLARIMKFYNQKGRTLPKNAKSSFKLCRRSVLYLLT
ncbi:MAG: TetR/AcrR family transcriptional regulator C-terminal domain-containing protein [Firmicutes bacterium]|nr:TetR/AcrR family transcriptional regulator C-terminal domain-containing protein [Bacillota bacterium]